MSWSDEEPLPIEKEEWFCIILFSIIFLYTQDYPLANGSTMFFGFIFAGIIRLPSYIMGRFK